MDPGVLPVAPVRWARPHMLRCSRRSVTLVGWELRFKENRLYSFSLFKLCVKSILVLGHTEMLSCTTLTFPLRAASVIKELQASVSTKWFLYSVGFYSIFPFFFLVFFTLFQWPNSCDETPPLRVLLCNSQTCLSSSLQWGNSSSCFCSFSRNAGGSRTPMLLYLTAAGNSITADNASIFKRDR